MIKRGFVAKARKNHIEQLTAEFIVIGGGLAGVCAAITAARAGTKVVLVQDRPVLGGNASSEVRIWALGATSHMGNNNRWSREGGVIDEIMLENQHCNKDGNPIYFDSILLDKVISEPNITLLLNTAAYQVNKSTEREISSVEAFCSQNSTHYVISAPLFCDATGDGLVGFNAGASFRIGAESREEFGELMAGEDESGELLGHTLFFYSKDAGHPVKYNAPSFAYTQEEIGALPRSQNIHGHDSGVKFWWVEYGGIRDTIYETEEIKWELWKIVYGIWDYIKNSGQFTGVDNLTLEWIGTVPGKRESRRFNGEYMLRQQDVVEQTQFEDAVSFGGWAIDIHPSEGIYSDKPACSQFHSKGVYQIPYRCFVSKDIDNLYFAGRNISASHIAYGSTRVMITCAHGGQAVGEAAAMCSELGVKPTDLNEPIKMQQLQQRLNLFGHGIPGVPLNQDDNKAAFAKIIASSELHLEQYSQHEFMALRQSVAQLIPLQAGRVPKIRIDVIAEQNTEITCQLRVSGKPYNYTPDTTLKTVTNIVKQGKQTLEFDMSDVTTAGQYGFFCFFANEHIQIAVSEQLVTGTVSVFNKVHKVVSNTGKQVSPINSGIESFEFWTPERRPKGKNLALAFEPALSCFDKEQVVNGHLRPWLQANAWIAAFNDQHPTLTMEWASPQELNGITLYFDCDYDHALETVLMQHPETNMPYCVQSYRVKTVEGQVLADVVGNYQTVNRIHFDKVMSSKKLIIEIDHPSANVPASLFQVQVW